MKTIRLLSCLVLAASPVVALPGQTTIPDGASRSEGSTALGTDWRGPNRYQVLYSGSILTRLPDMTVREIQLRADGANSFPGRLLFVTVTMSSRGVPAPGLADRTSFNANLGTDATVVFTRKLVSFPATSGTGDLYVSLPLDQAFPYRRFDNLLVQFDFEPAPGQLVPNPWFVDGLEFPLTGWSGETRTFGVPCSANGDVQVSLASLPIGGLLGQVTWRFTSDAPAGLPAVIAFGTGNPSVDLTPFGAPGCFLYNDLQAMIGTQSYPAGAGSYYVAFNRLPRDFTLTGLRVFGQFLLLDPTANALGVRMSPGTFVSLDTPPSPILATTIRGLPSGHVGQLRENTAPVLRIR